MFFFSGGDGGMGNHDGTDHEHVHLEAVMSFLGVLPRQGLFLQSRLDELYSHSLEDMLQELDTACLGLVVVGIIFGISVFIQNSLFTFLQERESQKQRAPRIMAREADGSR